MEPVLFHVDNHSRLSEAELRKRARAEVSRSSLIQMAAAGSKAAAMALHAGFWPFVREFELAIDQQKLPRKPLVAKFGHEASRRSFIRMAQAVREMKEEEGSHAAHWQEDARNLKITLGNDQLVPGIRALIESAYTKDLPRFFAVLAGTELIAEELSRCLIASSSFLALFSRKRWVWGEVHLLAHCNGPSHLDIDLDLARAYSPTDDIGAIRRSIETTIALFGRAAADVNQALNPALW